MSYRYLLSGLALAGFLVAAGSAQAAQGSPNREVNLPHVCKGGPNAGLACTNDAECPRSKCEIDYLRGSGTMFMADLTLIVDDDVSKFDGTEEVTDVVAVTIFLKTQFRGKDYLLAQTYQNLEAGDLATALQTGPIIADTNLSRGPVDESKLNDALDEGFIDGDPTRSILDDVLWQGGDNEMADELRSIFGVMGKPVVVGVPKILEKVEHTDHESNGLSSVVSLKVKFRFVPEP